MFKLTWRDVLKLVWGEVKDETYEMAASSFVRGIVVGAVLASVVWAIAVFGR